MKEDILAGNKGGGQGVDFSTNQGIEMATGLLWKRRQTQDNPGASMLLPSSHLGVLCLAVSWQIHSSSVLAQQVTPKLRGLN